MQNLRHGVCDSCQEEARLYLDLEHASFRGRLCLRCSNIVALAEDDPLVLRKLASYLEAGHVERT